MHVSWLTITYLFQTCCCLLFIDGLINWLTEFVRRVVLLVLLQYCCRCHRTPRSGMPSRRIRIPYVEALPDAIVCPFLYANLGCWRRGILRLTRFRLDSLEWNQNVSFVYPSVSTCKSLSVSQSGNDRPPSNLRRPKVAPILEYSYRVCTAQFLDPVPFERNCTTAPVARVTPTPNYLARPWSAYGTGSYVL